MNKEVCCDCAYIEAVFEKILTAFFLTLFKHLNGNNGKVLLIKLTTKNVYNFQFLKLQFIKIFSCNYQQRIFSIF